VLSPTKEIQEFKALEENKNIDNIHEQIKLIERYLNEVYIPKHDRFGGELTLSMRVNRLVSKYVSSVEERIALIELLGKIGN